MNPGHDLDNADVSNFLNGLVAKSVSAALSGTERDFQRAGLHLQ